MASLPNMKTFVLAVCKPFISSLKCLYDFKVKYMFQRVSKQDESLRALQTQFAELNTNVLKLIEVINASRQEIFDIRKKLYTSEEVRTMNRRLSELNYISGALYDKVYEVIHTGTVQNPTLPDFNNPELPEDKTESTPAEPTPVTPAESV